MSTVGFHVSFQDSEVSRAVSRLADFAKASGHHVSIHSPSPIRWNDSAWSREVLTESSVPVADWLGRNQILIWVHAPGETILNRVASLGCKTVLLSPWDIILEQLRPCYQMADVVVTPCRQGLDLFRETWGVRSRYVPWDVGLPLTRGHPVAEDRVRLFFPLHREQALRVHPATLGLLANILHRASFADIVLVYNPRSLSPSSHRLIRRLNRVYGPSGQFHGISDRSITRDDLLLQYGRSDLTVWSSEFEGLATVGLESLSMGTPVFAYDAPPQSEFLIPGCNAQLVPCELKYNWFGAPIVIPDLAVFEDHLVKLINNPGELKSLRKSTRHGLAIRQKDFEDGWADILESV